VGKKCIEPEGKAEHFLLQDERIEARPQIADRFAPRGFGYDTGGRRPLRANCMNPTGRETPPDPVGIWIERDPWVTNCASTIGCDGLAGDSRNDEEPSGETSTRQRCGRKFSLEIERPVGEPLTAASRRIEAVECEPRYGI